MTIAEFILARLGDDERDCYTAGDPVSWCDRAEGSHYDSKRVLAEIAAKRAILADHANQNADADWAAGTEWADDYGLPAICSRCEEHHDAAPWPCPTLRALALPYADHPDFDDAWRLT